MFRKSKSSYSLYKTQSKYNASIKEALKILRLSRTINARDKALLYKIKTLKDTATVFMYSNLY